MADGIPEYLQTATHVKTRKPRKRVLKDRLSMKARRLLQCQRLQQTQPQLQSLLQYRDCNKHTIKPQVSAPVTPVVSALVEAPHGITVVDATLDELKEAMRKKIWTPSYIFSSRYRSQEQGC
jgi:hypothetical protein